MNCNQYIDIATNKLKVSCCCCVKPCRRYVLTAVGNPCVPALPMCPAVAPRVPPCSVLAPAPPRVAACCALTKPCHSSCECSAEACGTNFKPPEDNSREGYRNQRALLLKVDDDYEARDELQAALNKWST